MMFNRLAQFLLALLAAVCLTGCAALGQSEPTPLPTVILGGDSAAPLATDNPSPRPAGGGVTASGVVVPAQQAQLAFALGGTVLSVNVALGDTVSAGQALVTLDATEVRLAVVQAEADLAAAQSNYDTIKATQAAQQEASIAAATLALKKAQNALDQLNQNAALASAEAQLAVANAQKALDEAQRIRTNMNYPRANQTTIDGAQAFYDLKEDELQTAHEAYDRVKGLAPDNPERSRALLNLSNAQKERDRALATLNWYLGKNSEKDIAKADADLALAQAQFNAAKQELEDTKDGPSASDLALVQAGIASAQAQLDQANASAATDPLALAQAQLDAARARLELAQAQLAKTTLTAPFDGTVAAVNTRSGEWATPGQPALTLVNVALLRIETTDLSERDVPGIEIGQSVTVFIKALNQTVPGRVSAISPLADTLGGDVVYKTIIDLDEPAPGLRAGMSAEVSFD